MYKMAISNLVSYAFIWKTNKNGIFLDQIWTQSLNHWICTLFIPIYYASMFCSIEVYAVGYKKVIHHLVYWLLPYDRSFGDNPTS